MPRRMSLTVLVCLGLLATCTTSASASRTKLPNIIVLYADDLGFGDVGCNNAESRIPTENIDRLAREGMRFVDAHSSSGICTPSRYALLTGRYHWRQFHDIVDSFGPSVFAPGRVTMADMLRSRGYRTACIGKWHLGWDWAAIRKPGAEEVSVGGKRMGYPADAFDWSRPVPGGPCAHGFDHYFGDDVPNFPPYAWIEDDRVLTAPSVPYAPNPKPREGSDEGRPGPMVAGWRLDAVMPRLVEHAVTWIEQQRRGQPFFLYLPFTAPHAPIVPAPEFVGRSGAGVYGDFVVQTDAAVGAVLAALDRTGLAADTLVVFSSDNGPEAYAWERVRATGHRSMGTLRGLKRDVWEGGHRVPMVVRWPGVVPPGRTSDALFGQVDWMATIAAAVGVQLPSDAAEDSLDQLPVLRGERAAVRTSLVHNTYADKFALRSGDWLYIDSPDGGHRKPPPWFAAQEGLSDPEGLVGLYNLAEDPRQQRNRAAELPSVAAGLAQQLASLRAQVRSAPQR
jgi:arylsulfatase A